MKCIFDCPVILEHRLAFATQHCKLGMNPADMADKTIQTALEQLRNQQGNSFSCRIVDPHDGSSGMVLRR